MSKKITPITTDEWIDVLFAPKQVKPPNAFTLDDIMKKKGISRSTASYRINELIKEGKLKKGKCRENGTTKNYYLPTK